MVVRAVAVAVVIALGTAIGVAWDRQGRDRVTFGRREYTGGRVAPLPTRFVEADARRRGMELFVPAHWARGGWAAPTVIALRRGDGRYLLYGLSGGP